MYLILLLIINPSRIGQINHRAILVLSKIIISNTISKHSLNKITINISLKISLCLQLQLSLFQNLSYNHKLPMSQFHSNIANLAFILRITTIPHWIRTKARASILSTSSSKLQVISKWDFNRTANLILSPKRSNNKTTSEQLTMNIIELKLISLSFH